MENWNRPREEIDALMRVLDAYLHRKSDELMRNGVRVQVIGRVNMLGRRLQEAIAGLEQRTEANTALRLTFALSYGGRTELVDAMRRLARDVEAGRLDPEAIDEKEIQARLYAPDLPDPDLLIRTGGEHRVSNFLLWQLAYTELWITEALWPDFSRKDLVEALLVYQSRERRFGRTGAQARAGT
jgi:undecaprenyl diphosphate synthase